MGFDAGALLFKIQAVGAALFKQDMRESKTAIEDVEKASTKAKGSADQLGDATDKASDKSRKSKKPLDEQAKATEEVGEQSRKAKPKQDEQAKATEQQMEAAKKLSTALLAVGIAVTAVVGLSVAKYAEFDAAMSQTSAATMATRQEQEALGDAALDAGADTAYSAKEAAAAEEELAKAGQSVADIVGGSLDGALALAAAGQLEVARSAEIMATTLTQFRLPAEQAAHVSDVLAAGAGKAQGSVEDMGLAMSYVGPLAKSFGWSLEETAGVIAYFSSQGIIGEKAGTSLRGVLAALQAPSVAAANVMQEYGIQVYDASGKMLGAAQLAEQFRTRLGGLTDQERQAALGRIFGNESLLGATLLYEGGAAAVEKWTGQVNDAGYAAEQAAMRQDNLAGDIEKLGGAFDTALIRTGSGANDILRAQVQLITQLVDWYGELDAPIQSTVLVLGVAVAAMALFAGGAVGARAKFIELKAALDTTNASMSRTAVMGGAVGLALTGIVTVLALVAQAQAEAAARAQSYADTLEAGTHKITASTRELAQENLALDKSFLWANFGSAYDNAEKLGLSLEVVTDAANGNATALREVADVIDVATGGGEAATRMAEELGISQLDLAQSAGILRDAVKGESDSLAEAVHQQEQKERAEATAAAQSLESAEASQTAADAYLTNAEAVSDLESELQKLVDTINEANGVGQDAVSANIDYKNALAEVDQAIADGKTGLEESTQVGRDNVDMLNGLAQAAQEAAEKQYALDHNTDTYTATMEAGRQQLVDRAQQMGYNADEAQRLADTIFRIPSQSEWTMIANTAFASTELGRFIADAERKVIRIGVTTYAKDGPGGQVRISTPGAPDSYADGGVVRYYASGASENHIAQISQAGNVRIWSEQETGGESYVPHALSKRGRSDQIMGETAEILGGRYLPASELANHQTSTRPAGRPQTVYQVTQYNKFEQTDPRLQVLALGAGLKRVMSS